MEARESAPTEGDRSIEVCELGPLGVRHHGVWHGVRGARTASVLALLVMRHPHAVTTDELIEAAWPSPDQPPSARQSLANIVARLRANHGTDFVASTTAGYRLGDGISSDRRRFEAEVVEAAGREDEPDRTLAILERALGRWRDDPWRGMERPVEIEADRARLLDLRERALRAQARALAAAGRHADAITLLRDRVDTDPLDEGAWHELASSLAALRRRTAALRVIEEARRALADRGLGLPRGLEVLEIRLLAGDDGWETPGMPVPRSELVGRTTEIREVRELLRSARLLTLHGAGGAGKTRVALEAADGADPDGFRGFVDLSRAHTPDEIDLEFARGLGLPRDRIEAYDSDARRDVIAERAATLEGVLIVDNCEHVLSEARDVIDRVLTRPTGVHIISTSRAPLGLAGERLYQMPPFDDGPELFRRRALENGADPRTEFATDLLTRISAQVGHLPLAIEIAAAQIPYRTLVEIASELERGATHRDERQPDERHRTMDATIRWSHSTLDPVVGHAFVALGVFPAEFRRSDAEAVIAGADADRVLDELVRCSLVERTDDSGESVYRLLAPVRQWASTRLEETGRWSEAAQRMADWLLELSDRDYGDVWWRLPVADELEPRLPAAWPAVEALRACGRTADALTLAARFAGPGHLFGHTNPLIDLLSQLIPEVDDVPTKADGLVALSVCCLNAKRGDLFGEALGRLDALDGTDRLRHQIFVHRMNALWVMWAELLEGAPHAESAALLARARDLEHALGSPNDLACIEWFQSCLHLLDEDWTEAEMAARRSRDAAPDSIFDLVATGCLAYALVHQGRAADALAVSDTHPARFRYTYYGDLLGIARGLALLRSDDIEAGLDVLAAVNGRAAETSFPLHTEDVGIALAAAAHMLGHEDLAIGLLGSGLQGSGPHVGHFVSTVCRDLDIPLTMRWLAPDERRILNAGQASRNAATVEELRRRT